MPRYKNGVFTVYLSPIGLHAKVQAVPVSEVIFLLFGLGLLNFSVSEGLGGIGHAASLIYTDFTIRVTLISGCCKTTVDDYVR